MNATTTAPAGEPTLLKHPIEDVILWGNVRKTINPASIDEMAESVLQHGIIQPPLARLREGKVELYAGQRRFYGQTRAITLAEERAKDEALAPDLREHFRLRSHDLKIMTLLVQDLDDRTIKERQLLENLQREDVSPREEADGYAELMAMVDDQGAPMYTLEKIAERVGKNFRYVSNRLGLRKAPEKMWAAYEEGRIGTRHLELVGRIPTPKKREEAAKAILEPKYRQTPLTVEETLELIEEEYRVSLKGCGFDLKDEELLPVEYKDEERIKGGACITCPHFTGNMKELEGELMGNKEKGRGRSGGIAGNLCCNPACFEEKQKLLWRRTKEAAEREGRRVMDVDQSSKEFDQYSGRLPYNSKFVDLGERPNVHDTGHYSEEQHPEWDELLKGTDAKKQAIMVRHPKTKRVHLLLEREKAIELAEGNGHKEIFKNRPKPQKSSGKGSGSGGNSAADDEESKARLREGRIEEHIECLFLGSVAEKIRTIKTPDAVVMECVLDSYLELVDLDPPRLLNPLVGVALDDYGADVGEMLEQRITADLKANPSAWFGWLAVLTAAVEMERDYSAKGKDAISKVRICKTLMERLGIDVKEIVKLAKESVAKKEESEAAAKELAELEKKGKVEFTATDLVEYHTKGVMPRRQTMEAVLHKLAENAGKETGVEQVQWISAEIKKAFPKAKAKVIEDLSDTQAMELIAGLAPQEKKDAKEPAKEKNAPLKKVVEKVAKKAAKRVPAKKAAKSRA